MTSGEHPPAVRVKCPECRRLVASLDDRLGHALDCQRPYEEQRRTRRGKR